jgi:hypothetical protein
MFSFQNCFDIHKEGIGGEVTKPPPLNEIRLPNQRIMLALQQNHCSDRENHPKSTVDKAPMSVDNSIKQVDNASLQGRF